MIIFDMISTKKTLPTIRIFSASMLTCLERFLTRLTTLIHYLGRHSCLDRFNIIRGIFDILSMYINIDFNICCCSDKTGDLTFFLGDYLSAGMFLFGGMISVHYFPKVLYPQDVTTIRHNTEITRNVPVNNLCVSLTFRKPIVS